MVPKAQVLVGIYQAAEDPDLSAMGPLMSVWRGLTPALLEKDVDSFSQSFLIEQVGSDLA